MPVHQICIVSAFIAAGCCGFIGFALGLSGAVVLGISASRDPEKDFNLLHYPCTVEYVNVDRRETHHRRDNRDEYECHDHYWYGFTVPERTTVYESKEVRTKVCDNRCSRCGGPTAPHFDVNETTECWQPVEGFEPEFPYSCGNRPECYKIFDPADGPRGETHTHPDLPPQPRFA